MVIGAEIGPIECAGDGGSRDSEGGKGRGEVRDAGLAGQTEPEFPVHGIGQLGGEAAETGGQVAPEEDVGGFAVDVLEAEGVAGQAGPIEEAVGAEGAADGDEPSVGGNDLGGGEDQGDVGMGGDGRDFLGEAVGEEVVVGVEIVDEGGGGEGETALGIAGLPEIGRIAVNMQA